TSSADAAAQAADAAAAAWRDWLTARALPPTLSPEAALETLDLAEQARLRVEARERAAGKAARLRGAVAAFERSAAELAAAFPETAARARGDAAGALRLLQAEADGHAARRAEREALLEKQAELDVSLAGLGRSIEELEERQARWFAAGGAADELAWLAALERSERLAGIEEELFLLNATVTAGLSEAEQAQLDAWLTELDEAALRAESAGAERAWREAEAERGRLLELLGRARQRLEQLLRDGDRQRLIGEREAVSAALEALIDRYAVLAMSMTMIRRTKRIMEEQRQPAVLREASRLMGRLTDGRYKRILLREGEGAIALEAADGCLVESGFLSRGTAEQLYLAMRFALADEAAAAHALPLLLDDPFVNFDRDRQRAAADVLGELAERRQIVFFTCHAHIRELVMERIPAAKLVELARE
ncbi:ATP-binding protein, partial [Paenibacillus sp. GCM10023250]|uniref:ATP-binding protein n=1 Tax=Paenibacillus sp. GCM10023250 TaxID=3252648 RepID=UPI003615CC2A